MLVLNRKIKESIKIGQNIKVTIIRSGRNSVSIGIQAPKEIPINRENLYQVKQPMGNMEL